MKKLILIALILISSNAWAAGSCVEISPGENSLSYSRPGVKWITFECTADAADGTIANTTITGLKSYWGVGVDVWDDGVTSPTTTTDIAINDSVSGINYFVTNGTDIMTDLPNSDFFYNDRAAVNDYPLLKRDLTMVISGNSVNSAHFWVTIAGSESRK